MFMQSGDPFGRCINFLMKRHYTKKFCSSQSHLLLEFQFGKTFELLHKLKKFDMFNELKNVNLQENFLRSFLTFETTKLRKQNFENSHWEGEE